MDHSDSSQPPPSSSTTENPIVAVGRKVKSVLTTDQRPSVRILRESSSTGSTGIAKKFASHRSSHGKAPGPESRAEFAASPSKETASANRFVDARNRTGAAIRSIFGREGHNTDDGSYENEYDPDTVDLLDVVGMYDQCTLKARN
jgi:hypothetical protein